jgi:hypothetical protein
MKLLAEKVFEPLRNHFNEPIVITSFFRSLAVNSAVKGSVTSQHMKGEAFDLQAIAPMTNKQIFDWVNNNLTFDQLIWEGGTKENPRWVHISYTAGYNRKQVLYIL